MDECAGRSASGSGVRDGGSQPPLAPPARQISVSNPMYGLHTGHVSSSKDGSWAGKQRGPRQASNTHQPAVAVSPAEPGMGSTRPHIRVRYRFPRERERALYAFLAVGALLFVAQSLSTSAVILTLLGGATLLLAAGASVLLLANNLRWADAKHAIQSFPFLTGLAAATANVITDWVAARSVGTAATLLISISVPMLHLCCVVVYRRLVLGILLLALSGSTVLVVAASLFAEDEVLFSVGEVTYTYLSVRRSCIATLWTTTVVLLMSSVQKRNGPHAHLLVPVSVLQYEPWLEDALGLPAWALTRARAAVIVDRSHSAAADAAAVEASRSANQGCTPPFMRALVEVRPDVVAGGGLPVGASNELQASWQVVRALHRCVHLREEGATSAATAPAMGAEGMGLRVKLAIISAAATGVGLYFAVYFMPDCSGAVLAPIVPMCIFVASWLIFRGRMSRRQLRRAAQQPNSWIVWAWLALLTVNNLYRLVIWVTRGDSCNTIRLASNIVSLDSAITTFLLMPALRVRAYRLEATLALICLTTQLFLATGWSLFSPPTFYSIPFPGGAVLGEEDVLRNCFTQLALSLARVIASGLMSSTQLSSPLRKRAVRRAGQRTSTLNPGLKVLAPRRNQVDAYVVDLVGEILAHGVSRSLREATGPEAWAAAQAVVGATVR